MRFAGFVVALSLLGASLPAQAGRPQNSSPFSFKRTKSPAATKVLDASGDWVATFTDGSRTVAVKGPTRTFDETTAAQPVSHATWVRLLPAPFDGKVDTSWLTAAMSDTSPDILAVAMQYVAGAPSVVTSDGLRIAGDASYGPLLDDGTRQEGSDFSDYLGISWTYPEGTDQPEARQYGSLDCSGYMRMVWGYRSGFPLTLEPNGVALPRRAVQMHASAPGTVVIRNSGTQVTDMGRLQIGDLVFFDVNDDDGTAIDHVGMYLGRDAGGDHRFISSRKTLDGPTLGDVGGRSILNGTGFYATGFRATRRL